MKDNTAQELIAIFMGMQSTPRGWKDKEGFLNDLKIGDTFKVLQFDTNQDWLVRVIKDIDNMNLSSYKDIDGNEVEIWEIPFRNLDQKEYNLLLDKVVHFIKWWNSLEIGEII